MHPYAQLKQVNSPEARTAMEKIFEAEQKRFERYMHKIIRQLIYADDCEYNDYYSEALLGLERALTKCRTPLLPPGYAYLCIRNAVIDYHRKRARIQSREGYCLTEIDTVDTADEL